MTLDNIISTAAIFQGCVSLGLTAFIPIVYRKSSRLFHVAFIALSYTMLSFSSVYAVYHAEIPEPWRVCFVIVAWLVGDVALLNMLQPRRIYEAMSLGKKP